MEVAIKAWNRKTRVTRDYFITVIFAYNAHMIIISSSIIIIIIIIIVFSVVAVVVAIHSAPALQVVKFDLQSCGLAL